MEFQSLSDHEPIYRHNFFFFLADSVLFNLAMNIAGPTTLLPDFIRHLTRSEILIGLSSTLFDVGGTLPQLFIARTLLRFERKKAWYVGPNIPARLLMLVFAVMVLVLGPTRPLAMLLVFFFCYGLMGVGNGISNVPGWVLAGTSLDSRWRARVLGLTMAIVGLLMLGVAPLVGLVLNSTRLAFPNNYALLLGAAGLLFALSVVPALFLHELPGSPAADKLPAPGEFLSSLGRIMRTDLPFRAMVITRLLTALFAMAGPFYVGFATTQLGLSSGVAVPALLLMQTIGGIGGALIYTWLGARHNVLYIRLALGCAALLPLSALLAAAIGPLPLYLGFLIAGLTGSNLLAGYSNWVIAYTPPEQRSIYAGLFSTAAAVTSLLAPFIGGTLAQQVGYEALFAVALVMVLGALFVTLRYIPNPRPE